MKEIKTSSAIKYNNINEKLTCGLKNLITAIFPYMPISLSGRSPSGVTKYISSRMFLAKIKFKSVGDVKLP